MTIGSAKDPMRSERADSGRENQILTRRYHVVVAAQHDGAFGRQHLGRVQHQAIYPAQLVVELRPWRRIAIGEVEAPDDDVANDRFDVATVPVLGISHAECQSSTQSMTPHGVNPAWVKDLYRLVKPRRDRGSGSAADSARPFVGSGLFADVRGVR